MKTRTKTGTQYVGCFVGIWFALWATGTAAAGEAAISRVKLPRPMPAGFV